MDTMFNPELFLNQTISESNSTELLPVPEGEYVAVSDPVNAESFKSYDIKTGDRAGQKGHSLNIQWNINDESGQLKELLGRKPTARQNIMLDIKSDGNLEFGKGRNVELGRLREALGQNGNGQPWAFSRLGSQVAKIKVKHTLDQGTGRLYVNVVSVTRV
jgi:hypothetical protein